jgi:hypothetical protein
VQAHPSAAALLLQQGPGLIEALGAVHDQLLPAVHRVARGGASGSGTSPQLLLLLRQACHVELGSERLAQLLLLHCYVQPAAGSAAGGGSSSSSGAGSSKAGGSGGSTVARGEALLQALMLLGHREEESAAGGGSGGAAGGGLSLGQALAQRLGLGGSIQAALVGGSLSLDEAQADYVAALLDLSSLAAAPGPPVPGAAAAAAAAEARLAAGSSQAAPTLDTALLKSKIQQASSVQLTLMPQILLPPTLSQFATVGPVDTFPANSCSTHCLPCR